MAYKKKEQQEKEFVDYILSVGGIKGYAAMDEGRRTHYEFRLNNGTLRYWTNMSTENLKRLGIESDGK